MENPGTGKVRGIFFEVVPVANSPNGSVRNNSLNEQNSERGNAEEPVQDDGDRMPAGYLLDSGLGQCNLNVVHEKYDCVRNTKAGDGKLLKVRNVAMRINQVYEYMSAFYTQHNTHRVPETIDGPRPTSPFSRFIK
ncbi:hypothetical protein CLF_104074 [Clonorchis sinensis]|uniref:Uncharacterized protein n=1 Tax=Clonorchis sinensis TaxID=79923 RepID=G7YAW0_CLOSI|nr:hypothetical protein CLF_104074 [Clonorchis sinensis]